MAEGAESVRILEKLGKAALCALLMLALLGAAAGAETLRVGVRDDIINFGFYNETTGKYYGLEIDLAAELAQRIGCDGVEYITVTPDTRKDMLLNGEVDVVIATYSIAESREENFDFSAPYYEDETIIMVEKSTLFGSIRDLKDKNIGIVNGTNAGPLLAQKGLGEVERLYHERIELYRKAADATLDNSHGYQAGMYGLQKLITTMFNIYA